MMSSISTTIKVLKLSKLIIEKDCVQEYYKNFVNYHLIQFINFFATQIIIKEGASIFPQKLLTNWLIVKMETIKTEDQSLSSDSDSDENLEPKVSSYLYAQLLKLIHQENYQRGRQPQTSYSKYYYQLIQHFGYHEIDYFGTKKIIFKQRSKHQTSLIQQWKQRIAQVNQAQKHQDRNFWTKQKQNAQRLIGFDQLWMIVKPVDFIYNCEKNRRANTFINGEVAFTHRGRIICSSQQMRKIGCVQRLPLFIAKILFPETTFLKANFYHYHQEMKKIQQAFCKLFPQEDQSQIDHYQIVYQFPKFANLTEQELLILSDGILEKLQKQTNYKFRCSFSFSLPVCKILIKREELDSFNDIVILQKWTDMKNYLRSTSVHYLSTIQQNFGVFLHNFGIFKIEDLIDKIRVLQIIIGRQPAKTILHEALGADQYQQQVDSADSEDQQINQLLLEIYCPPAKRKLTFAAIKQKKYLRRVPFTGIKKVQNHLKQINFDKVTCTNGFSLGETKRQYVQTFLKFQKAGFGKKIKLQEIQQQSQWSSQSSDNDK